MFHVDEVWMQRGLDALDEMFRVSDATKRDMIQFLFDEGFWDKGRLSWAAAVARFNDCLNPNKPQFFKISELWALMKAFRRHGLLHAIADDLGYQALRQMPTEERRQALLERIAAGQEALAALLAHAHAELADLDTKPVVRVHPALRDGRGAFCAADSTRTGDDPAANPEDQRRVF